MIEEPTLIEMRRNEVNQYDSNIVMYTSLIASLPSEWPEHLQQYKGRTDQQQIASEISDLEDVALISQLLFREQCERLLRSEMLERTKAASILAVLEAQANNP
jgi:hypothetical protein